MKYYSIFISDTVGSREDILRLFWYTDRLDEDIPDINALLTI